MAVVAWVIGLLSQTFGGAAKPIPTMRLNFQLPENGFQSGHKQWATMAIAIHLNQVEKVLECPCGSS
jgi:hypothetical protein